MSDSDDTDVLLLIPPDLFLVPPSDTDDEFNKSLTKGGVVSEIIEHVQSLESRISVIESKENSSSEKHSVSQLSLNPKSTVKPRRWSSLPSTPCSRPKRYKRTNKMQHERNRINNPFKTHSSRLWEKHEDLTSLSDNSALKSASRHTFRSLHAGSSRNHNLHANHSFPKSARRSLFPLNLHRKSTENLAVGSKKVEDMNIAEVEQLLKEMEMTEQELSKSLRTGNKGDYVETHGKVQNKFQTGEQFMKSSRIADDKLCDFNISNDSTQYLDSDKLISEFKVWKSTNDKDKLKNAFDKTDASGGQEIGHVTSGFHETLGREGSFGLRNKNAHTSDLTASYVSHNEPKQPSQDSKYREMSSDIFGSFSNILSRVELSKPGGSEQAESIDLCSESRGKLNIDDGGLNYNEPQSNYFKKSNNGTINTDMCILKPQRLLALSDFWENDGTKSQEEILRIKIEEEKLRREHCEYLIQELQKKLLEQQEKVAVAIRVDNKKNTMIRHFQDSWEKLKHKSQSLESECNNLRGVIKSMSEKHSSEINELQSKVDTCQGKLSQALDLAAGYKEDRDNLVKKKVDMLQSHADEMEKYKTLVQQEEKVCNQIRDDYNRLVEKNQQLEDVLKSAQQELNKERLKSGEVRSEMAAIHQALDTCGAELTVLRQEKESLQLKLKEESNKCQSLEQNKQKLLATLDDAKKFEKQAKDKADALLEQQEKVRCELRDVYQKQLDEVVKAKQQEFQTQLDSAEVAFQTELDARQRAIAECAARKLKTIIDKHQLEIDLIEEKHKEEKRLCELQLAQVVQRSALMEAQLSSQQASKNQLVEQLHSVMQKQWQQALHIIAGGNGDSASAFQKINIDKFFDLKNPLNNDVMANRITNAYQEPVRLEPFTSNGVDTQHVIRSRENQAESLITLTSNDEGSVSSKKDGKNDLRGYIQMILDMQQSNDDIIKARLTENNATPPPIYREVPKKHYTKKELSIMSEDSVTWRPISEISAGDVSEYIAIPQKLGKEQEKVKPPWK